MGEKKKEKNNNCVLFLNCVSKMSYLGCFGLVPVGLAGPCCNGNGCGRCRILCRTCNAARLRIDLGFGASGGGRCGLGGFHPGGGTLSKSLATSRVFFMNSPNPMQVARAASMAAYLLLMTASILMLLLGWLGPLRRGKLGLLVLAIAVVCRSLLGRLDA